eukprot:TRINITY_DN8485_c0_g1_i1.p1 TRINITY_DN8485_c0_g1~~TRINITY_DN8485_c0_g1_i1.p1  ORF type:complete len:246 (-),score=73.33 TRINITY_DN8485_c0_g1_i1:36-773(-)
MEKKEKKVNGIFSLLKMTNAKLLNRNGTMELKETRERSGSKVDDIYRLHETLKATLGTGDLRSAVKKPDDEVLEEWLSLNVLNFFNQINLLYGSISEYCTPQSCPTMNAGPKYEYLWADGTTIKKPIKCNAQDYVNYLMGWVQALLEDEKVFPVEDSADFPKDFVSVVETIMKKLFRVYAHIYHCHINEIIELGVEAHLNTNFKHFYLFTKQFNLVGEKELAPMKVRIGVIEEQLLQHDQENKNE